MDIGKSNDNFKDRKPKCFNCNKYGHCNDLKLKLRLQLRQRLERS